MQFLSGFIDGLLGLRIGQLPGGVHLEDYGFRGLPVLLSVGYLVVRPGEGWLIGLLGEEGL